MVVWNLEMFNLSIAHPAMNFSEFIFDRKSCQKLFIVTWCIKRLWIMFVNINISVALFFWGWSCYCKRNVLEKWLKTGFVFESVFSFIDHKLSNFWLPLNCQWKKCHDISNHWERDFMSDFSKRSVFSYNQIDFFLWKLCICITGTLAL